MSMTNRLSIANCMLNSTSAVTSTGTSNKHCGNRGYVSSLQKRQKTYAAQCEHEMDNRISVVYAARGKQLCRKAFAHWFSLNERTTTRRATHISMTPELLMYKNKIHESHAGHLGVNRKIIDKFLDHVSDTFTLECPSGRGVGEDHTVKALPIDMTHIEIYNDDIQQFVEMRQAARIRLHCIIGSGTFSAFIRYCDREYPVLRLVKARSDFCNFCTAAWNDLH